MIKILKGDTSADISFALAEGFDYSGATVHVEYQGAVKTFTECAAGDVLALRFSADETAVMSLGSYPVVVRITNPSGMVKTIQNAKTKICVTDDPAEVSGGAIALDVKGTLYGIEDLPERWTEADIVAKLREIMRRGGAVLCALLTFSAFGASVQTARKDAIYHDAQIVTNVTFDGLLTEHQDISGKADKSDTYTKAEVDAAIAAGGGGSSTQEQADWSESDSSKVSYIKNKPSTMPPSAHTHGQSDVTGLQAALDAKVSIEDLEEGFTAWTIVASSPPPSGSLEMVFDETEQKWDVWYLGASVVSELKGDADSVSLSWATSGVGSITATRTKLKPTKTSELTNDSGFLTSHQSIAGKADKVASATSGNFAALDANGNLTDSGHKHADYLTEHQELRYAMVTKTPAAVSEWSYSDGVDLGGYVPHTSPSFIAGSGWNIQLWDPVEQDEGLYSYNLYDTTSTINATTLHFVVDEGDGNVPSANTALTATRTTTNVVTLDDRAVNTIAPASGASFTIAMGALPQGVTGKVRDCILVVDCTSLGENDAAPTVTWPSNFHPRTDIETDLAIVEAGKRAVFYISEYAAGEFAVGGWVETTGGYTPSNGGSGT